MGRMARCLAVMVLTISLLTLTVSHGARGETVVTEKKATDPAEGGPRRWELSIPGGHKMYASPTFSSPVIRTLSDGAILTNFGCVDAENLLWCNVKPLRQRTRGFVPAEHLRPARGPDVVVPMGVDNSPERARQGQFDLQGQIACAQEQGQSMSQCKFGVARSSGGDASVVVMFANGFRRTLYFSHGTFIRADTTMSGTGFDTDWRKDGALHVIRVDDQRFELPHAAIFGR